LALVLLAVLVPVAAAQEPDDDFPPPDEDAPTQTIEVVGQAALTARDDAARLTIAMSARRPSQQAALAAAARKQRRVISRLRAAGVEASDIALLNVRLTRFHFNGRVTHAVARNAIRLTVHNFRRVRALTAAATSAGATNVTRPTYFLSDPTALYDRALVDAFGDAQDKAEALAEQSDQTLGEPISVREGPPSNPVAVDIRHTRVSATVTVEFELEEF
jgi:hypothetical protein